MDLSGDSLDICDFSDSVFFQDFYGNLSVMIIEMGNEIEEMK